MLRNARNQAGISRDIAALKLHIGSRTLQNYETGITSAPPDVILKMAEIYHAPELPAEYCSEMCPIGQIYAHNLAKQEQLAVTVLGLLQGMASVQSIRANLINIAADGQVEEKERPEFRRIMQDVCELERRIGELKLAAMRNGISVEEMMPEERRVPA